MRKTVLFMMVSLDGYFEGPNHDLSWHNVDKEFNEFAVENLEGSDVLVFGRRTYELMNNFWPTYKPPAGDKNNVIVAEKMNSMPKVVFSRTLKTATWGGKSGNITLIKSDIAEEITKLKQQPGKEIAVFGSSNLCVSLLEAGVLDELRIMVNPVALGAGTTLFEGINGKFNFKLIKTRRFKSGNTLLSYAVSKGQ